MPPEAPQAGSPADWLRHARADLALAQQATHAQLLELLCFHAQQACEKSLKAVLVQFGTSVPKTHNIQMLLRLVAANCTVPTELMACSQLTDYAVTTRYPGVYEPVTDADYKEAVEQADGVVCWAERAIAAKPS